MNEIRIICADSPYGKGNCQYAKVVEERGEFPVIIEKLTTDADGKKGIIREERIETHRYAVYCTHPKQKINLLERLNPMVAYAIFQRIALKLLSFPILISIIHILL